jgi:hypothetical protein
MFILLITAAVNAPSLRFEKMVSQVVKKITVRKIFVIRFFFKEMTLLCIHIQYTYIVGKYTIYLYEI